jgi:hypothetical protein
MDHGTQSDLQFAPSEATQRGTSWTPVNRLDIQDELLAHKSDNSRIQDETKKRDASQSDYDCSVLSRRVLDQPRVF